MSRRTKSASVIGGVIAAYFVAFPEDLTPFERILHLTQAVAPGAYALLVTPILVAGAVRIWGRPAATGPT
jgi:hypothetical protein